MFDPMPSRVTVNEVGTRDGFQNVAAFIPTGDKIAIIERLIDAGLKDFELTSFVSPKAIPQLADATEVCRAIVGKYGSAINCSALVPNLKGAQSAWDAGVREVACVISVSVSHNKANINRTHEESLAELAKIVDSLPGMKVRVDLATAFACPFEGWTNIESVYALTEKVAQLGVKDIVLADTIGVATPDRVSRLSVGIRKIFPKLNFGLHIHDTRGMGLANTLAGLLAGITTFETSIAGLGGCPFAPGAAGNTATEDLVNMLGGMKIETGIDLEKLITVVGLVNQKVEAKTNSHMSQAKFYESLK